MAKFDVSQKAGAIYYLLEQESSLSIKELGMMTCSMERHVLLALGWLARDNRIELYNSDGELCVKLNQAPMTEIHY